MKEENQHENQLEIKQLILDCYKKARQESKLTSKTAVLNFLSDQLNMNVSERTLQRYYQKFIEGVGSEGIPNRQILDSLSTYLGFEDFITYCKTLDFKKSKTKSPKRKLKQFLIGISAACAIGIGSYFAGSNQAQCMKWESTEYKIVDCEKESSTVSPILPIDESLMENFRKINVNENTQFFEYGKPLIWYIKIDGKIEFFNSPGNHPVTGKPLKPVTQYIVDKYVLKLKKQ